RWMRNGKCRPPPASAQSTARRVDSSCTEALRACTALARSAGCAELAESHAHVASESLGQVTLVRETSRQSNLDDSFIGRGKPATGELNAEPAHVFTDGAAPVPPESAGKVVRADSGLRGEVGKRELLGEPAPENVRHATEPRGRPVPRDRGGPARRRREQFEREPLHRQRREVVHPAILLVEPEGEGGPRASPGLRRANQKRCSIS